VFSQFKLLSFTFFQTLFAPDQTKGVDHSDEQRKSNAINGVATARLQAHLREAHTMHKHSLHTQYDVFAKNWLTCQKVTVVPF